jgi:hypothetical protein
MHTQASTKEGFMLTKGGHKPLRLWVVGSALPSATFGIRLCEGGA